MMKHLKTRDCYVLLAIRMMSLLIANAITREAKKESFAGVAEDWCCCLGSVRS